MISSFPAHDRRTFFVQLLFLMTPRTSVGCPQSTEQIETVLFVIPSGESFPITECIGWMAGTLRHLCAHSYHGRVTSAVCRTWRKGRLNKRSWNTEMATHLMTLRASAPNQTPHILAESLRVNCYPQRYQLAASKWFLQWFLSILAFQACNN